MNSFIKIKKKQNQDTRWNRIERKHINSIKFPNRITDGNAGYISYLRNKTFFKDHHIKLLNGDDGPTKRLDPNLVMNIRHENIRQSRRRNEQLNDCHPKPQISEQNQYESILDKNGLILSTQIVNEEIEKFKECMEAKRPKPAHDFFEYLNSYDKYKFVNAKLNRYRSELEQSKSNNVRCDFEPSSICEYGIETIDTIETESNKCDTGMSFVDYNIDDHFLNSERTSSTDEITITRKNEANAAIYDPDLNENYFRTDLKVEVVLKERPATSRRLELYGTRANISQVENNIQNVEEAEEENTYEHFELIPEPPTDRNFRPESKRKPTPDLAENLTVHKINIDQLKPSTSHKRYENTMNDEEIANAEKNAIICELFSEKNRANFGLLQKYFLKWFHYNTMEKLSKQSSIGDQTRLQKIQKFLQTINLERKKYVHKAKKMENDERSEAAAKRRDAAENPIILAKKYNSKLKIQQDIIELQRVKLERQERMITELKLTKLSDEAREAQSELKKELRQVIQTGNQQARSKARCLQMIGNLKEQKDDEEYENLQAKGLIMPKFLIEMHARTLERQTKHQQAKERRDNLEREKEEQRLAAEEAKRLQDEESKRQRMEELRQKRKEEKLRKIQKEKERLAFIANKKRADDHYRTKLLKFGFRRFQILILLKKRYEKRAHEFLCQKLRRDIFQRWNNHVVSVWRDRKQKADMCYNNHCLRAIMEMWKKFYLIEHSKKLVAVDWCDMKIIERAFGAWNCVTAQSRLAMEIKLRQAAVHYEWNLKWRVLDHWRRLQIILRIEKETEARRERWRHKIWEVLPDYTPNNEDT